MKRRLLLIDLSNQAYKAAASHPHLTNGDVFTGGLYGFICAVAKAIAVTGATSICLCEDRKPYIRSQTYPEYKSLRKNTKDPVLVEKVNTTVQQVRKLCEITGWPIWSIPTFESDDLVAHAVMFNRHRFEKIIAMSNDSDLYQLFEYKCFEVYKGKSGIYDKDDFLKDFPNIPPAYWVRMLAITGTHNEVAGVSGVGPATAMKIMNDPERSRAFHKEHASLIKRNIELITLPHKAFPKDAQLPPKGVYNERALVRFCSQYSIQLQRWMGENFERTA
jgi:5'-3' exonuclease